ncbi:MAG: hypothetical protein E7426_02125 [Ruminococcaceae bacterium]|nr:hypothetical protein [Oscillospiraceae bacterium]
MRKGKIRINEREFPFLWEENYTVEKLLMRPTLSFTLQELNGCLKYIMLQPPLPYQPQIADDIRSGDLVLYGNSWLVLFYNPLVAPMNVTRLGRLEDTAGLEEMVGPGSVSLELIAPQEEQA